MSLFRSNRAGDVQVIDPFLTDVARRYTTDGYIADELLPTIKVALLSGQYPVFDRNYWFATDVDAESSDRGPSNEVDFTWSTEGYVCKQYSLKVSITDLEEAQAETPLRLRKTKTEYLAKRMLHAREIRAANVLDTVSNGGQLDNAMTSTPSVNWDQDTATIETDLKTGKEAIYHQIGRPPNTLVIPHAVAYAMSLQQDIREIISYEMMGGSKDSMLRLGGRLLPPEIHGMRVVIPEALKSAAAEGNSGTLSPIWSDHVRLLYVDKSATWGSPSVGYRIQHTPPEVKKWRTDDPDVEWVRELERVDEKIVSPQAGYVLRSVLS